VDGSLALLIDLGFIGCLVALLVLLIRQFRRTGEGDHTNDDHTGRDD
jgi:hypothetical protein